LVAFEAGEPEDGMLKYTLIRYGGAETLKVLRGDLIDTAALKPEIRKSIVDAIQQRLDHSTDSDSSDTLKTSGEVPPSQEALTKMRRVLLNHPNDEQFYEVFEPMTRYDPGLLAEYPCELGQSGQGLERS